MVINYSINTEANQTNALKDYFIIPEIYLLLCKMPPFLYEK